jgi:hypothetical protein
MVSLSENEDFNYIIACLLKVKTRFGCADRQEEEINVLIGSAEKLQKHKF